MASDNPPFSIKAVLIGLAVDWGGSTILATLVAVAFWISIVSEAPPQSPPGTVIVGRDGSRSYVPPNGPARDEWVKAEIEKRTNSHVWQIPLLIAGLLSTGLGGYVTALIAKHAQLKHALVTGTLSLLTGLAFSAAAGPERFTQWNGIIGILLVVPCAGIGGYLRFRQSHRSTAGESAAGL
jgi:hypothetical protein